MSEEERERVRWGVMPCEVLPEGHFLYVEDQGTSAWLPGKAFSEQPIGGKRRKEIS